MKTRRVLYVVSKTPETVKSSRSVLKAGVHSFKRDDGFSEKCKNGSELEVSKSTLPLCLSCEGVGFVFHCVCLDQYTVPKLTLGM